MHSEEERPRFDSKILQPPAKLGCIHSGIFAKDDAVHPINAMCPGFLPMEPQAMKILEPLRVLLAHPPFSRHNIAYPLQLGHSDGSLQIRQSKIETKLFVKKAALRLKT